MNFDWAHRWIKSFAESPEKGASFYGMSSHEYKNGKIVRECTFSDIIAVMMRQLGHLQ